MCENILTKLLPEYKILPVEIRQEATILDKAITEKVIEKEQFFPPKLEISVFASDDIITASSVHENDSTDPVANKCFSGKIYWDN